MYKRIICVILVLSLILSLTITVTAASSYVEMEQANDEAMKLRVLGLFMGTNNGYELERAPTRLEGLVMLVRLMGEDSSAKDCDYAHPFEDVPTWGNGYVAWAYFKGYTAGTSKTEFSPNKSMKVNEYFAFVLRALGYGKDFVWPYSTEKARELKIIPSTAYLSTDVPFLRADVAHISFLAMSTYIKGSENCLYEDLSQRGIIKSETALAVFYKEERVGERILKDEEETVKIRAMSGDDTLAWLNGLRIKDNALNAPGKVYSFTNTNNSMSNCTLSVEGNTLTLKGIETSAGCRIDSELLRLEVINDNLKIYNHYFPKITPSPYFSETMSLSDFTPGRYNIWATAFKGIYGYKIISAIWLNGEPGNWYFEGPTATESNSKLLRDANAKPVEYWLECFPKGKFADDIRLAVPKNSSSYQTAYNAYTWLTQNVKYDTANIKTPIKSKKSAEDVFYGKLTICEGYARLMIWMLNLYGIPARMASGYVLSWNIDGKSTIGDKKLADHAWVEFQDENGNWIICDPTWGAGSASPYSWFDVNRTYLDNVRLVTDYSQN